MAKSNSLRRAIRENPIEFMTLLTAIATVIVLAWQLLQLQWQLQELNGTLESQAYNYIIGAQLDLDKTFIENAEYRRYFQENIELPKEADKRQTIWAIADAKLDVIDNFYSQEGHINWKRYTRDGWEEYFRESFK